MSDRQVLTVAGRYTNIRPLCEFVAAGARAAGLDDKAVHHVELCCDEASTNIIEHAYGGEDLGDITVSYDVRDGAFYIVLTDHGRAFDPTAVPEPVLPSIEGQVADDIVESLQVGGLGLHFIRRLMDDVLFDFDEARGNTLTLVKNLPTGDKP